MSQASSSTPTIALRSLLFHARESHPHSATPHDVAGRSMLDSNMGISASSGDCSNTTLLCQNGGICEILTVTTSHHDTMPQRCLCPPGYGGLECEIQTKVCFTIYNQDRYCQAGAPCLLSRDGQQDYCDCNQAYDLSAFAGMECEYSATEYCTVDGSMSKTAFCTNGGACQAYMEEANENDAVHAGCDCPLGFEGDHCEYLKGQYPRDINNEIEHRGNGHHVFHGILIAMFCVSLALLGNMIFRWRKRKNSKKRNGVVLSPAMA